MKYILRFIAICLFVTSYSTFAEDQLPELPPDIKGKLPAEQAELLSQISQFSYQVLIEVPEKGLKTQSSLLNSIITTRKWLETIQLPLFQLLALYLQEGVDRAIVNEMYRKEMSKHGYSIHTPFKTDSFDLALLENLQDLNKISEQKAIKYAVSLDGVIPNFCRQQDYPYEIYSEGELLMKVSPEIAKSIETLISTFGMLGQLTEKQMASFLFTQTLLTIDQARNIRLAFEVYQEQKGFPKTSRQLRTFIEAKLPFGETMRRQLSTGYFTTASDVIGTLERYVERMPAYYGNG